MMWKNLFLAFCPVVFISCLAPDQAKVEHRPLNLRFEDYLEREDGLKNNPNVFVMFYWPQKLDFESALYPDNLPFEDKLEAVVTEVNRLSKVIDGYDQEIYDFVHAAQYPALKAKYDECSATENAAYPDCEQLVANWLPVKKTQQKGAALGEIKATLEGPNVETPQNWVPGLTEESNNNIFRLSGSRFLIQLKNFKLRQDASTRNGDIVDYQASVNSMGRQLMSFTIKERGEDGQYNGITHLIELERKGFLDYARYLGKTSMYRDGVLERLGVAKIDFVYAQTNE